MADWPDDLLKTLTEHCKNEPCCFPSNLKSAYPNKSPKDLAETANALIREGKVEVFLQLGIDTILLRPCANPFEITKQHENGAKSLHAQLQNHAFPGAMFSPHTFHEWLKAAIKPEQLANYINLMLRTSYLTLITCDTGYNGVNFYLTII